MIPPRKHEPSMSCSCQWYLLLTVAISCSSFLLSNMSSLSGCLLLAIAMPSKAPMATGSVAASLRRLNSTAASHATGHADGSAAKTTGHADGASIQGKKRTVNAIERQWRLDLAGLRSGESDVAAGPPPVSHEPLASDSDESQLDKKRSKANRGRRGCPPHGP